MSAREDFCAIIQKRRACFMTVRRCSVESRQTTAVENQWADLWKSASQAQRVSHRRSTSKASSPSVCRCEPLSGASLLSGIQGREPGAATKTFGDDVSADPNVLLLSPTNFSKEPSLEIGTVKRSNRRPRTRALDQMKSSRIIHAARFINKCLSV